MVADPLGVEGTPPEVRRSILFVCTGNTCRSPLAESLCRSKLAAALGCPPEDLEAKGFLVASAGVMAYPGDPATPEAVLVAGEAGADLGGHRSRPLIPEMLERATDVFAMTEMHLMALLSVPRAVGPEPKLLCENEDLPDPIGGDLDEYRACARVIAVQLDRLIPGWLGP